MIDRYSLSEMSQLWSPETRFHFMLQVEKKVALVQGEMNIIPKSAAKVICKKARFSYKSILKREQVSRHDVVAFVDEVTSYLGSAGAYFHYGLTSSDVLDTALSLQIKESASLIENRFILLRDTLKYMACEYKTILCVGRTHGMHAEPTTFGFKMLGFLAQLVRTNRYFKESVVNCCVGKLSGAVGTYFSMPKELELQVCKKLELEPETLATQVVPRDRIACLVFSISLFGAFIERLAIELRHLQKTEVGEIKEGFYKGQAGSSAMPHKTNPIVAENLTGLSRMLRSYTGLSLENIALWHERDISHSSVERIILPDAFILLDYALYRLNHLLKHLHIKKDKMKDNLEMSNGLVYSSMVLNRLVQKGLSRKKAYPLVQEISQQVNKKTHFRTLLKNHKQIKKYLNSKELDNLFSFDKGINNLLKHLEETVKQF